MNKIFKAVKTDGAFFFILAILNLPIMFQGFFAKDFWLYAKYFLWTAFLIFILTLAMNFSLTKRKKLKSSLQRILMTIFSILFVAENFYLYKFKKTLDVDAVEILLENLFTPEVLIEIAIFVTLLKIGKDDLRKIFKSMPNKKIKRLTYMLTIIFLFGIILSVI